MRGRTRTVAVLSTGVAALLLGAGCALPEGVDGDLTGGWAAMPEPVQFQPAAGVCHDDDYEQAGPLADYRPVDCDEPHVTETVHVGEFTGSVTERSTPPDPATAAWRSAFQDCDQGAEEYLGADFRYARLWLGVTVPSPEAWEGGARWFRCEVVSFEDRVLFGLSRTGSLAGALAEDSDLRLRCFEVTLDDDETSVQRMEPVDCDQPHHAEFVGVWEAPDGPYLDGDSSDDVHRGCRERVAAYVDVPVDGDLSSRTGTIADWMEEADWDNGDRKFRCYLWLNGEELEGSLEGGGTSALPVR